MIDLRGIKARPRDVDAMSAHAPSLIELHCSVEDLRWRPQQTYTARLAVHLPEYHEGALIDPASLDEAKRLAAEGLYADGVRQAVAWAPRFNGGLPHRPIVVLHPGGNDVEEATAWKVDEMRERLGRTVRALRLAAGSEAEVLVENMPRSPWFFGGCWRAHLLLTGRDLALFCKAHDVGATLDLCHLYLACQELGVPMDREVAAALPWVRHVHYSDAKGVDQEGLQLGEGDYQVERHIQALAGLGPAVTAVPEVWFGHEQDGAGFVTAWQRLQERLGVLPAGVAGG